jgi:hypothetical protein
MRLLCEGGSEVREEKRAVLRRTYFPTTEAYVSVLTRDLAELLDTDGSSERPIGRIDPKPCVLCGGRGKYWVPGDFYEHGYWELCQGSKDRPHFPYLLKTHGGKK